MPAERAKDIDVKFLRTLFGIRADPRAGLIPLYNSVVGEARRPIWYADMGVPDTIDGRFDMVAAVLSLALMRIETEGEKGRRAAALLTELFVDDMDGQLREIGVGDVVVGKHLGKMMAAMGGRLSSYRESIGDRGALEQALLRNLWRGEAGEEARPALVAERLQSIAERFAAVAFGELLAHGLPE